MKDGIPKGNVRTQVQGSLMTILDVANLICLPVITLRIVTPRNKL